MNQLSKFIYLAGVCDNLTCIFAIISVLGAITSGIWLSFALQPCSNEMKRRPPIVVGVFCVFIGVLACLIPSKDTMYAIAASEMGEKALQTPLAGKAEQALESWLDSKIKAVATPSKAE